MNKTILLLSTVISLLAFNGCKKDKQQDTDITSFFNNTVWTGEIKYKTGGLTSLAQPYSIAFEGNGNFKWIEFGGDYGGNYTVDNGAKKITLQFTGVSNAKLTANITDDKKFGLITPAASYTWEILNGRLNAVSGQLLENTVWNGSFNSGVSGTLSRQLKFVTGQQVSLFAGTSTLSGTFPYVRKNGTLRFAWGVGGVYKSFLVLLPDNKITCMEHWTAGSVPGGLPMSFVYELNK